MAFLSPTFSGRLTLDRVPEDLPARVRRRLEAGLLTAGYRGARTDYRVVSEDGSGITFAAHGFLTTYNVGLNRVSIRREGNEVRYDVSYWGWTWIAVAHGALLGVAFLVAFFFLPGLREGVARTSNGPPLFWGLVAFFCLFWPWVLTAMHRGMAERALRRILLETLSPEGAAGGAGASRPAR